mmetsp:Transcript_57718/g.185494  ORF Transcript_57718/g.185494 Transcript_57718/m.185494 type:complete len:175 (+) Transcript_57718:102-626(+)
MPQAQHMRERSRSPRRQLGLPCGRRLGARVASVVARLGVGSALYSSARWILGPGAEESEAELLSDEEQAIDGEESHEEEEAEEEAGGNELAEDGGPRERLTESEIAALPVQVFAEVRASEQQPVEECRICLEQFQPADELRAMPCRHHFHKTCVDRWLRTSRRCPVCRHQLGPA